MYDGRNRCREKLNGTQWKIPVTVPFYEDRLRPSFLPSNENPELRLLS